MFKSESCSRSVLRSLDAQSCCIVQQTCTVWNVLVRDLCRLNGFIELAVRSGHTSTVTLLINQSPQRALQGCLCWAACPSQGRMLFEEHLPPNTDMISTILEAAKANAVQIQEDACGLAFALTCTVARSGNADTVRRLLEAGANPLGIEQNIMGGPTAFSADQLLQKAAYNGNTATVALLLDALIDVEHRALFGPSPKHSALFVAAAADTGNLALYGGAPIEDGTRLQVVALLLRRGADPSCLGYQELRYVCKNFGLGGNGRKDDLLARLREFV